MKKLIFSLLAVLIVVGIVLNAIDLKSEYKAERALFKITKHFNEMAKDPKSVPEATFDKLVIDYENYIKNYSYSRTIPAATIYLGRVYRVRENYPKSREIFEDVLKKYGQNPEIAVQALVDIGKSYDDQKDDANLLKTYKRIQNDYPLTGLGIRIPLIISQIYIKENDLPAANKALDDAISYYKQLISKYPKTQVEVSCLKLLATAYLGKRQWLNAVKSLMDLLDKYPTAQGARDVQNIVSTINTISLMYLKDYDLPINFYRDFMKKYPDYPFNKTFEQLIEKINEMKTKAANPSYGNKN